MSITGFECLTLDIIADLAVGGEFNQVNKGDDVLAHVIDDSTSWIHS